MGGHWTGHFQGGVSSPLERDSWSPSRRGHSSSAPECARQLAQAPVYFGSSALVAVLLGFFFPHPGLRFHAKIPLPHAVIRGLSPPGAGSPGRTDRTCWQSWSATRAAAPRAQQLDPGNPAAGFALRSPASVRPARLPKSNLGAWALTGDPGPREPEGSLSQHL